MDVELQLTISKIPRQKGLTVKCAVDTKKYECSIRISDEEIEAIDLERFEPYGDCASITRGFNKMKIFS